MACAHEKSCPLFPELRSTLETWRMVYCDDEAKWMTCARYVLASQGRVVPLTLLPNGKNLASFLEKR
jgi:hypothetical protein